MKKNYILLVMLGAFCTQVNSQTVLSHSTDNTTSIGGSVACAANPDTVPGTGDEYSTTNTFMRAYTPSNFGFSEDFEIQGVNFFLSLGDNGGSNPTVNYNVTVSTSDAAFPAGTFTVIASKDYAATVAQDGNLIEVLFDTPVVVDSGTELIVSVTPDESPTAAPDHFDARIGVNAAGENAPSYIVASGCSIATPSTYASIGFGDQMAVLDLVGGAALAIDDHLFSSISIYPNPTNGIIHLDLANATSLKNVNLFDVTGKKILEVGNNTTIDISDFNPGIYLMRVETNNGVITKKVVKN